MKRPSNPQGQSQDPEARGLKVQLLLDKATSMPRHELQSVSTAKPDNFVARFNLGRAYFVQGLSARTGPPKSSLIGRSNSRPD